MPTYVFADQHFALDVLLCDCTHALGTCKLADPARAGTQLLLVLLTEAATIELMCGCSAAQDYV